MAEKERGKKKEMKKTKKTKRPEKTFSIFSIFSVRTLYSVALFLIKFNLLAIPMYLVIYFNVEFVPIQQFLADSVYAVLRASGYEVAKSGLVLTLTSGFTIVNVKMTVDCTGWKSMYALAALALATPLPDGKRKFKFKSKFESRLKFIAAGAAAVFALNFLRVLTTVLSFYSFGLQALDVVHTLLWREGLIVAVVLIWGFWLLHRMAEK